ncbi:MAG: amidohydrolase family protein [Alphaproteobacteria bacterium]|nr:amidohydrolase family protein [Alphaproteobacteria bacterium]MCB9794809.1 amidohydrolase family protein [Alphaproteobacteria bacterium]
MDKPLEPIARHSDDLVIDTDRHVVETWSIFTEYAEPQFRGAVYQPLALPNGQEVLAIAGRPMPFSTAMWSDPYANKFFADGRFVPNREMTRGLDPEGYLEDMDADGVDVALLFPTLALGNYTIPAGPVGCALSRAYGRWVTEWASTAPRRLRVAYPLNLYDMENALRDARWAVETLNATALMLIALPVRGIPLHDPSFDALWALATELNVTVAIHSLSSLPDSEGRGPLVEMSPGVKLFGNNMLLHHLVSHRIQQQLAMASFLVGGVLSRFPSLKVLFVEAGGAWVQTWLEGMDQHFDDHQMRRSVPWLRRRPSQVFAEQCAVAMGSDEKLLPGTVGGALPLRSVCWASDHPHYDSTHPDPVSGLRAQLEERYPDHTAAVLGRSAARLLGLS